MTRKPERRQAGLRGKNVSCLSQKQFSFSELDTGISRTGSKGFAFEKGEVIADECAQIEIGGGKRISQQLSSFLPACYISPVMFCPLFLLVRGNEAPGWFTLAYSAVILSGVVGYILWIRLGRRKWDQARALNWPQAMANFDDGEIVTMRKGRSETIAGYEVWFGYDYQQDGEQEGLYTLPFRGEFKTEEGAEEYRKTVANTRIPVRVSPRNPKRSCVLDHDVAPLLNGSSIVQSRSSQR